MVRRIYKDIAPYYDRLMDDVNYGRWVEYIQELFTVYDFIPHTILDLGCGTGIPAHYFLKEGYEVIGIDGSLDMLTVAKKKLDTFDPPLIQSRFEYFAIKKNVDLVISLFDSLNNILTEKDLLQTFSNVSRSLRKDGLFIFDMNTIYGLSRMNSSSTYTKESGGVYSIWKSKYDRKRVLASLFVTLFVSENGHYRRIEETHLEKGYSFTQLKRLLKKSGFSRISFYEHLSFSRANFRTQRVMVLSQRG
jgi:ubiquinone/menaquinone biosynthesis C-methylase UbiE